jgi:nicotinate-nucleotide adenylyltransferase
MEKIGILGGTFDPVHEGHLELAGFAKEAAGLSSVIFMPAYIQPFKQGKQTASSDDRKKMLEFSIRGIPGFQMSSYELDREEISYTYDTLTACKDYFPKAELFFISGSDSYFNIENWYKGKELLRNFSYIVGRREGKELSLINRKAGELRERYGTETIIIEKCIRTVSSTMIRARIKESLSVTGLINPDVENYIYERGLYL